MKTQQIFEKYENSGKYFDYIKIDGCLQDNYIIWGEGLKTCIIKEHYLNEWSSDIIYRLYNKTPKKYEKVIELFLNDEFEKAEKLFFN